MKQLSKLQTIIFMAGALLMTIGAGLTILRLAVAPWLFAVGAVGFTSMQLQQRYDGQNFVIRRLRRMMILSDVLFLVAAVLLLANQDNLFHFDQFIYIKYVRNNWVVTLLIAAMLQLYSVHRIDSELQKEAKKL
jgi:hypothetical protein